MIVDDGFRQGGRWRCAEIGCEGRYLGEEVPLQMASSLVLAVCDTEAVATWERDEVLVEYVVERELEG